MAPSDRPATAQVDRDQIIAAARFGDALAYSAYAKRVAAATPALLQDKTFDPRSPLTRQAMLEFLKHAEFDTVNCNFDQDEAALRRGLRRLRAGVLLTLMQRDLDGSADLAEITAGMTALAEIAVTCTITWFDRMQRAEFGLPRGEGSGAPQFLLAVGMGKLGGGELNVSSDIDLVLAYAEEGETDGARRISNHEYFARLGQRVIRALDDVTADGRVFRVDMRLRPNGDAGPLVCGFDMLEQYFLTQGREWERYAWIKARVVNFDSDQGLARVVRPFVFRKYLDFGAFAAMRALHAQIRAEVARRELAEHIKLGPGGIREIEFIAQVFQLLRGGRDPALQLRPTLAVLAALAVRGLLPAAAAAELAEAYRFLRRLEHRLQYLDDQQTHDLPQQPATQELLAKAMGEPDYAALLVRLSQHRNLVIRQFEAIFAEPDTKAHPFAALWAGNPQKMIDGLAGADYGAPDISAARLVAARSGARYRQLGEAARMRFDRLVPRAIALAAATTNPDAALARMLDFLEAICRRSAYLALLDESPQALQRVADMLAASQWAAQYLTRNPLLLDELLDARSFEYEPDGAEFERELRIQLTLAGAPEQSTAADTERQLDVLREMHHAQLFRLLARDLAGLLSVERLADHISDFADRVLKVTLEICWNLVRRKCDAALPEVPRFAVIAYGKLGGKELGYASDLDLVFLYDDDPVRTQDAYARLGQRIITWLTSTTPAGTLFDVDLRLRPYGDSGLLVSHIDAFREYQTLHAWTWEHQALTRARCCAGDRALGREFDGIRRGILMHKREVATLAREITEMRGKMHLAHPNRSGEFDLKHDTGGMIDIEFAVQFLVLAHAHRHPELTENVGIIALLGVAGHLSLVEPELASQVQNAYREYRRRQHLLRLNGAQFARVPTVEIAALRNGVEEFWQRVLGSVASAADATPRQSGKEE
jgi:glutamate-ammonia-ligase adenylyltransferase